MQELTERQKALKRAGLYVIRRDLVRPRRRFMLRKGLDGAVHWAIAHEDDQGTALPWCHTETQARLIIFFRDPVDMPVAPTCVRCAIEVVKRVRLTNAELRRFR